ncbi:MAG TPA: DUF308 domain-containing protein [Pyrinomonadaceae bacterium]|nr:DUF308 domain-containing protein [Pyrinomonadaceae bacterium]
MTETVGVGLVARKWWAMLLRGLIAIVFGVIALARPGLTLITLILLFGIYVLADSITALWIGGYSRMWPFLIIGIIGVVVGLGTIAYPGLTAVTLLYVIALWSIVRGIGDLLTVLWWRSQQRSLAELIVGGLVSIVFGAWLLSAPAQGALAVVWVIGVYAVIVGVAMCIFAFRLRSQVPAA